VESDDIAPLHPDDLPKIGLKTASYILKSENPMSTLNKVLGDFPKYGASLATTEINDEFVNEYDENRLIGLAGGESVMWINGQVVDAEDMNIYALMDRLRSERQLVENVKSIGLSSPEALMLISHPALGSDEEESTQRFDWRDTEEGGNIIIWLNDLEKDKRYESWPTSVDFVSLETI